MDKKKIQEQRMKGYFINATKELLKGEGLTAVSVRSVADKAGYSYTTLYNYFKDLNDLIFECVKEFQLECKSFVEDKTKKEKNGKEKIKAITKAYTDYFIEYPGVFELFFIERMGNIGDKKYISELICTSLDKLCEPQWEYCVEQNIYDVESAEKKKQQLLFITMGILLFFQNRLQPDNYSSFVNLLKEQIDEIVD